MGNGYKEELDREISNNTDEGFMEDILIKRYLLETKTNA